MNKNLPEIARQIATELGCTVKLDGNEHCQQIFGAEIPFYIYSGHGDKLDISLIYPHTADNSLVARDSVYPTPSCPNIHVSATRTPAAIAADIKRRFFPAAKIVYAACLERAQRADQYGVICLVNAHDIAAVCEVATVRQETPNRHATVFLDTGGLSGKIEVLREDGTITLRGNVANIIKALAAIGKV